MRLVTTILAAACLLGTPAWAQEDDDDILLLADMDKAGELYSEGHDLYVAGDYLAAAEKFAESFHVLGDNKKAAYNAACSYALANMPTESIEYARYAMDLGMFDFEKDPDFANISETSEFLDLVWEAGIRKDAMEHQSIEPVFILPDGYDISANYPLLVAFHPFGSSPEDFAYRYEEVANEKGCILMLPRGTHVLGTGSFSWEFTQEEYERLLDEMEMAKLMYSINPDHIILTGFSQGGLMAYSLGMALSDRYCGIIPVGGTMPTNISADKMKNKDIRIYAFCGERDADATVQDNKEARDIFGDAGIDFNLDIYDAARDYPPNAVESIGEALDWILEQ